MMLTLGESAFLDASVPLMHPAGAMRASSSAVVAQSVAAHVEVPAAAQLSSKACAAVSATTHLTCVS